MTFLDPTYQIRNTPDQVIAEYDPFRDTGGQYNRKRAVCRIWVGSFEVDTATEVTAAVEPHLISVHVTDSITYAEAQIELDDRYGTLPIPPLNSPCMILLGWEGGGGEVTFEGHIEDIEHACARTQSPGRRLFIHAYGENFNSPGKEPQQDHLGEGAEPGKSEGSQIPLPEAIMKFAQAAGHTAVIHPELSKSKRDYWSIDQESFLNWSAKVSQELGIDFRVVKGTQAEFTIPGERADQQVIVLQAVYGENMIGWRVHPAAARPAWSESKQQYFDTRKAIWKGISSMIGNVMPAAASAAGYSPAGPAASASVAQDQAVGSGMSIANATKVGRVVIIGEPRAHAGAYVNIVGARPGVDGLWHTESIEHLYSRQGYITWLNVLYNQSPSQALTKIIKQMIGQDPNAMIKQNAAAFPTDPVSTASMLKGIPVSTMQEGVLSTVFGIQPGTLSDAQLQTLMTQIAQANPGDVIGGATANATSPLTAAQIQAAKTYLGP
jgi:hypothetical protein